MSQKPRKPMQMTTIHKCDLCDFTTKNAFFFKRHKVRCRKDHGFVRGKARRQTAGTGEDIENTASSLNTTLEDSVDVGDITVPGSMEEAEPADSSSVMETDSHAVLDASETSSIHGDDAHSDPELTSPSNSKLDVPKRRLYQCSKCEFLSKNSKDYLYHQVDMHQAKINIYSCKDCNYYSQHRHKVIRHAKAAHDTDAALLHNMQPEYIGTAAPHFITKPRTSQVKVKPINKRPVTKHGANKRKFLVKFGKPHTGLTEEVPSSMELTYSTAQCEDTLSVSAPISKQSDQLSRVVKEVELGNGEVIYKCKECTYVNEDKQQVAKHAVSWHVDTKSFTCSHCDYISFERNDFVSHRLTHRNEHQFKCEECTYSTDFRPNYDRHMSNHQGAFPNKCDLCTFGSGSEAVVRRHKANNHVTDPPVVQDSTPPPVKKLKLPVPKAASSVVTTFTSTATIFAATSAFAAPSAVTAATGSSGRKSLSPPKPKEQLQTPKNEQVPGSQNVKESYPFPLNKTLFLDSDSVSMVPRPTLPLPNVENAGFLSRELSPQRKLPPNITAYVEKDEGKLVCPICKLKYKRSSDLNRHMKRKHGVKLREYLENYSDGEPIPGLDMTVLNFDEEVELDDVNEEDNFYNDTDTNDDSNLMDMGDSSLNVSAKTDSDESPVPPEKLKCKYCSYQARWMSDLKRHFSVHSIQKRYKCNFCPKKYKYMGDLNVHVRKEHNKEPGEVKTVMVATLPKGKVTPALFKCPCCNYTSAWKSEVDRHSRSHTGEKSYKCSSCDYSTHWRGDIRRHVYRKHPELMVEGVSLNDVVVRNKDRSPELMPGKLEQSGAGADDSMQSMDASFSSDGERLSREVTPVKLNVSRSHEPSPEINMSDYVTKYTSGHSPTPSPIKDLGAGMYKCQYCGFIANAPSKMDSHIATHTNLKRYMCPVCGRRANWKWDIAKHIRRDHNDQVTQVIKLSKLEAEETIQSYIESNPVVRRDHHLNVKGEKNVAAESGNQYYKCSLCDFSAEKRISVTRHMRYMHTVEGQHGKVTFVKKSTSEKEQGTSNEGLTISGNVTPLEITPTKQAPATSKAVHTSPPNIVTPSKYASLVENFGPLDPSRPFMCSECGKRGATKGDVKKHYHYAHADKEIRIIYLGDGSQSVYSAKTEIGPGMPEKPPVSEQIMMAEVISQPSQQKNTSSADDGKHVSKEPKVVGYIKPFMCGLCGRRSNWRWDINKHVRMRHKGKDVQIIELTEGEARATIQDYVSRVLPALNKETMPRKKKRKYDEDYPDLEQNIDTSMEQMSYERMESDFSNMSSSSAPIIYSGKIPAGKYKQYKCSGCAYRSNFRSDILRHIPRRHGPNAKVIVLDKETARATLEEYSYTRYMEKLSNRTKKRDRKEGHHHAARTTPSGPLPKEAWAGLEKKIWKCSMCAYSNEDKVDVLKHVGKHNLKAYKCTACNWTSNFKGAVQRHIQGKHPSDNEALCRLSIKLIKEGPGMDQSGQSIMPDKNQSADSVNQSENINSAESLAPHLTAVTGLESMKNPQSFVSSTLFCCKMCNYNSIWRSAVSRHIRKIHKRKDYIVQIVKKIVRTSIIADMSSSPGTGSPVKGYSPARRPYSPRKKNFHCTICPYKTYKGKMLKFHMTCHKQQPGVKQAKCKYCPYYVSSTRLLSQHVNLHLQELRSPDTMTQSYPVTPVKKLVTPSSPARQSPQAPKRHKCEKCPYTTNSKNDFFYHKQFHRPKPTADYKCDYCDYWVSHRRLIKQHMKVHEEAGYTSDSVITPSKSDYSENSLVYDTVEIAAIKQRIIASKITPSISQSPLISPMKIAASCSVGGRRSFLRKDGSYRKIHQCRHCPYMNIRLRNMKLHELMHGRRSATHPLMKCPHCDYFVGSKGLLGHHMKVHQPDYGIDYVGQERDKDRRGSQTSEDSEIDSGNMPVQNKVDTLLEITRFKKYGCEKCPYASSKRARFQRHVEMHGSKQKCKCDFCDYSVPTMNLLNQHSRLHFEPNQNLLCAQSILNLQYLPEMPADVALASMMTNTDSKNPVSITHDHIDLYENQPEDLEPKKLYRCDRCPYANIRRDHLLAHLRCHMTKNDYSCPYCDYSVGKNHVLVQHVKVHFSPLPEFSEWLEENGDTERIKEVKNKNMSEALEVMKIYQNEKVDEKPANGLAAVKQGNQTDTAGDTKPAGLEDNGEASMKQEDNKSKQGDNNVVNTTESTSDAKGEVKSEDKKDIKPAGNNETSMADYKMSTDEKTEGGTRADGTENDGTQNGEEMTFVCQYCDRDFQTSDCLVRHEMQHLIGNSYEELVKQLLKAAESQQNKKQCVAELHGDAGNHIDDESEPKPSTSGSTKELKALLKDSKEKKRHEIAMETD